MQIILSNMRELLPFLVIPWLVFLFSTLRNPSRYRNSIFLMIALFFTLFYFAGMFGDYMGVVLLILFLFFMALMFLVPLILFVNGIIMVKKEGISFAHLLSLLLGLVIGGGEIAGVVMVLGSAEYGFFAKIDKYGFFLAMTVFYFSCLLLNFVVYSVFIQLLPHRYNFNYIIIHGCGLSGGERVTKLLAGRIEKAMKVYHKCKEKPYLIPSGGKGGDEKISEAKAIADYMIERGIPKEHILLEDGSATTMENLINSKKIIDARPGKKKTALVSTNYHIYRCLTYAKRIGMSCVGIGSGVALYFWPTALIREFVAVFKQKRFIIWSLIGYICFMSVMSVFLFYL